MSSERVAAVEQARGQLEQLILSGELQPGDRLNELSLAARFGIGRAHLREAVRALEEARLVEVIPNRGAHVRKLDFAEALELLEVRAGLARSAGRLAASRASREQIDEIRQVHGQMAEAASASDPASFHELNLRFHALLIEATHNQRLHDVDLAVRNEMQLYIRQNVSSPAQLRVSLAEHEAIVAALAAGDEEACGAAFERHILNGKRRLMDNLPAARRAGSASG